MKLIYNINDKPKFGKLLVFAIQQVLAIITATIVVPIIISGTYGAGEVEMSPAAALLGAGIGTLVYILLTKGKSPVFLGSSFAFLGSMSAAFAGAATVALGFAGLIVGAILAGLVYVIIAIIVKFVGAGWLNKLMPAAVIGPTVAIIGLSLAGNAVGDLQKSAATKVLSDELTALEETYQIEQEKYDLALALYNKAEASLKNATNETEKNILKGEVEILAKDLSIKEAALNEAKDKVSGEIAKVKKEQNINILISIGCGLITLAVTILCSTFGKKMVKLIPFICGIGAGYGFAVILTIIGAIANVEVLKVINFQPFVELYTNLIEKSKLAIELFQNGSTMDAIKSIYEASKTFIAIPDLTFVKASGIFGEFSNGTLNVQTLLSYLVAVAVAYVPVALVVFTEHVADHKNISSIIEKDLLEEPGLHRTLLGDGVGSMAGALVGGCPNTTYGESVACVAITKNASVATIFTAAILAIIISFLSPFVALVNTIPSFVMGGVCVALYGFIAVSGLKMIQKVDLGANRNLFVVATILIIGIGGLVISFGKIQITSIACALILGILVNLMLNKAKTTEAEENAE